ncbi:eag [Symbiodinium microadriaticum]|nr:eag [Symbiodinium microadriaticum]
MPPPKREDVQVGEEKWKVPFWQEPVKQEQLALHEDGNLIYAKREGYLQKRAGRSRFRWTIRFFELKDGQIRWWRPSFADQLRQPRPPQVVRNKEPRPRPVRCLDLTQLKRVTRTQVKFPYSTRILLQFKEDYTDYQLELRSERELEIMEWYKILIRFTMESCEAVVDRDDGRVALGQDSETDLDARAQISVSGCTHVSVGPIVRGNYSVDGSNHNKPAYRKEQKVSGLDVMLYYWDERDGVEFSGWWFGPKIGGDQVWAYQPTRATQTPPRTGWKAVFMYL